MLPNDPVIIIFMICMFFIDSKAIFVLTFLQVLTLKYVSI